MNIKQTVDVRLAACGYVHLGTYSGEDTATLRIDEDGSNTQLAIYNVNNRRLVNAIRYYLDRLVSINDDEEQRDSELVKELREVTKVLAKLEPKEVTSES